MAAVVGFAVVFDLIGSVVDYVGADFAEAESFGLNVADIVAVVVVATDVNCFDAANVELVSQEVVVAESVVVVVVVAPAVVVVAAAVVVEIAAAAAGTRQEKPPQSEILRDDVDRDTPAAPEWENPAWNSDNVDETSCKVGSAKQTG